MPPSSSNRTGEAPGSPKTDRPRWVGQWRVLRYDGAAPECPTYYRATRSSWDVIKEGASGRSVARHPILDVQGALLVLKDEGEPDEKAETWCVEVENGRLRVTAVSGPHEGAVGLAARMDDSQQVA